MDGLATIGHRNRSARSRVPWRRLRGALLLTSLVLAGSLLVVALPGSDYIENLGGRAAIETVLVVCAIAIVGLLLADFRRSRRRSDVLLLFAVALTGLTDFVFSGLPALSNHSMTSLGTGAPVACHLVAAVAFATAALTPESRIAGTGSRPGILALSASFAMVGITSLVATMAPASSFALHAARPAIQAGSIACCTITMVAGMGFYLRPERDHLLLAAALFARATSRLEFLVLPSLQPEWLTAWEGLRVSAAALMLAMAALRYATTSRRLADAALSAERERIAHELHDGLAQDLAYIALRSDDVEAHLGSGPQLSFAARRALAASRGIIVDLSASSAPNTGAALEQIADELAARFGVEIRVLVEGAETREGDADLRREARDAVVRIAREAIVNAIQDGAAHTIEVVLDHAGSGPLLRISDDGRGILEADTRKPCGHGLRAMTERASAVGGRLVMRRRREGGTEVTFLLASPVESHVTVDRSEVS